jgi:hypothetical protein
MLTKLRADQTLTSSDIKNIEVEIATWLQANKPSCDMIAANNGILRYVLSESQSTLDEAFASLSSTFGDTQYRMFTPTRVRPRGGKTPRHFSKTSDD